MEAIKSIMRYIQNGVLDLFYAVHRLAVGIWETVLEVAYINTTVTWSIMITVIIVMLIILILG